MRLLAVALFLLAVVLAAAACVDVPDGVRAQFAGPGATERSNFRPGRHGAAPPVEDSPPPPPTLSGATLDAARTAPDQNDTPSTTDGGGAP